jgi:hypothetical protein
LQAVEFILGNFSWPVGEGRAVAALAPADECAVFTNMLIHRRIIKKDMGEGLQKRTGFFYGISMGA